MTEYYSRVHTNENTLRKSNPDGFCFVISTKPGNNGPCEVTVRNAAQLLTDGGFRLATEAEARAFRAGQEMKRTQSPVMEALSAARARFAALTSGKGGL
jgi:hypothetical protein